MPSRHARRGHAGAWSPSQRMRWLSDPSWLTGASSLVDLFGAAVWYDKNRLTERGSRRALHEDLYAVAGDFWRAIDETLTEEHIERIAPAQETLFDPAEFTR